MTRKQLAAAFLEHLQRKHWQYLEREAKAATLENAINYATGSNAPAVTEVVDGKEVVGYRVRWM